VRRPVKTLFDFVASHPFSPFSIKEILLTILVQNPQSVHRGKFDFFALVTKYTNRHILYLDIYLIILEVIFLNDTFKALADPTRRQILRLLRKGDLTAGEIAEHFNMTKPSISHHLNLLKQARLVLSERKGQYIVYSLNTTVVQEVLRWLMEISDTPNRKE